MPSHTCRLLIIGLLIPCMLRGQQEDPARYYDVPNLVRQFGSLTVIPFFTGGEDKFWFAAGDTAGSSYYFIDPVLKLRRNMSDRKTLAEKLARLTNGPVDTADIRTSSFGADKDMGISVTWKGNHYVHEFESGNLVPAGTDRKTASWRNDLSPDKQWQVYAKGHDLFLRRLSDSSAFQLSTDGSQYYSFNMNDGDTSTAREAVTEARWFKSGGRFYVMRKDRRRVGDMAVLHSLFNPRPRLETYKYELPGDKEVTQYELFIGDTATKRLVRVNTARWEDQQLEIVSAGSSIFFLRKKRTRDEMELCSVDAATAEVKVLIRETSKPFINEDLFKVAVLQDGKEILWWSDRTGWGHYYLYDGNGKLKQAVTSGEWTAGRILKIDTTGRKFYFYGYGKDKSINPYYAFAYSVHFSGKALTLLTPENATHHVFIGPRGQYFVDNYSRIDLEPRTVVRRTNGKLVMEAWKPDMTPLYRYGWKHPEMFRIKAADGITDIYGLMWKPFDFDSTRRYPVISQVYPGPQTETVWSEFTVLDRYNNTSLAQSGFIVVCMGHRGSSPFRGKAYHTYGYGNLRDYALEDDVSGLRQLASRYPFIDTARVGIFGHSGGGMMAVAALCTYPDFYKAAVASSGNHDNRIYNHNWGETYQGIDSSASFQVKLNQDLATRLKGNLLLATGEVDANVHPGNTYRMVNALIQAGKDFDMLVLPGQSHTYDGKYKSYFQQRLRNFFKQHL